MEWAAVLRDVVIGLVLAGAAAAWIPESFWRSFFLTGHPLLAKVWGPVIGPVVAILSFVCSIGNVPLAGVSVDVLTEILIDRPVQVVAAYATDASNAPEWYEKIESVEWKTQPPAQVGSRVAFVARFLGRRLAYTYEFVELVADERLVMRTAQGPFPMETTYTWSSEAEGKTRMTLRNRGEPAGFSKLAAPFMTMAMRRANRKDLAALRRIVEVS